jgi:RNA polymerase sigma factor (sigma-70 family)
MRLKKLTAPDKERLPVGGKTYRLQAKVRKFITNKLNNRQLQWPWEITVELRLHINKIRNSLSAISHGIKRGYNNPNLRGCASNDRRSQELLYRQFYNPMMAVCFRYVRNREDALEVLHSGFLKVFQSIENFDETRSALFTWMQTIMVRTSIDFLRKKNPLAQAVEWTDSTDPEIEAEVLVSKSAEEILYYLKHLSYTTAAVFNLHVVEGYNHKEIARLLLITEGTSKWHLSEAKKKLAILLKNKEIA